jgi:hypothetical protein
MSSVSSAAPCSGSPRWRPLLIGPVFMAILRARQSAFFRGGAIIHESAHAHMAKHEHLLK